MGLGKGTTSTTPDCPSYPLPIEIPRPNWGTRLHNQQRGRPGSGARTVRCPPHPTHPLSCSYSHNSLAPTSGMGQPHLVATMATHPHNCTATQSTPRPVMPKLAHSFSATLRDGCGSSRPGLDVGVVG
mmetsp:Transcript_67623/g.119959  ORF Transcript_67623/g.119959 Transcript_67623/m.119959 type:complete len:128 (+) Transcript_67623:331-714(+)